MYFVNSNNMFLFSILDPLGMNQKNWINFVIIIILLISTTFLITALLRYSWWHTTKWSIGLNGVCKNDMPYDIKHRCLSFLGFINQDAETVQTMKLTIKGD